MIGFLDDLFVTLAHRSNGTAAALITAVQAEAKAQGWGVLRWITRDNNYRARGLYDKLAQKTDWVLYEMTAK
jgi:GNAT superfamily N-acetyltransferase